MDDRARLGRAAGQRLDSEPDTFGQVASLTDVDEVAGGREHVLALVGGQVYSWGDGSKGATGQGNYNDRSTPGLVPNLTTAT